MNIWRMKLRAGNHGPDMWPVCRQRDIAAITYQAIFDSDLTRLKKWDLDSDVQGAARSSMFRFAWEIKGGDIILVGDSISKSIVGRGYVTSPPGERAYRYNAKNPIREPNSPYVPWRHEVPVAWDDDFEPFRYRDGAPQHTVMHFDPGWVHFANGIRTVKQAPASEAQTAGTKPLDEGAYLRQTHASLRNIERLHSALSNRFSQWVRTRFAVHTEQERNGVDVSFEHGGIKHLAELKICYGGNTRAAIREALGQILEYNHYPPRIQTQSWWLVLDQDPAKSDRIYIDALRGKHTLPLRLAWPVMRGFDSYPKWSSS